MKRESSERFRVLASGLAGAVVTSLLVFTVLEALSPRNLLGRDASAVVASARAPADSTCA